jgi:hypothetical protein
MSSASHAPDEQAKRASTKAADGQLRIEVPHWAAGVRIYDNLLQPVPSAALHVQQQPPSSGQYFVEAALPAGVYEVEVALGETRQRQTVAVHPNKVNLMPRKTWNQLEFTSTAPFAYKAKDRDAYARNAEKWSRETTWKASSGGDSRLFLFVHTKDPQRYPSFAEGLEVLDGDLNLLSDLSEGVQKNARSGCLAFNADLPAGYYVLRRGRSGVRVRQQPVYLCAGWETHVFIEAKRTPSLRTLTMSMARRGAGFRPDDETALAAQVVFDSLGRSEGARSVTAREKITTLLQDKLENPWLGILAAYALLRMQGQAGSTGAADEARVQLQRVLGFLEIISDHPDVRALTLPPNQPAGSFWRPPLLRAGLQRVQAHATHFAATIPLESLTDVVLDNLVVNSPWTAWRKLDRTPLPAGAEYQATSRAGARSSPRKHATPAPAAMPYWGRPGDPGPLPQAAFEALEESTVAAEAPAQPAIATAHSALYEASLVQVTQSISQIGSLDALQETVAVNPALTPAELLNTISAQEVSSATGLPLARTEQTLAELRRRNEDEEAQEVWERALTTTERTTERVVLEYALHKARQPPPAPAHDMGAPLEAAPADAPVPAADMSMPAVAQPGVIEESVGKVRAESDRLLLAQGEESYASVARALGERLHQAANRLLLHADFVVRTDVRGRIQQPNAAFRLLLAPNATPSVDEAQRRQQSLAIQRTWEAALAAAPAGRSSLPHPLPDQPFPSWEVHRTTILDERTQTPQAYLYVLRSANLAQLAWDAFQQVSDLLPELALYSSLCAYGAPQSGDFLQKLEAVVLRLEQLTTPQAA